MSNELREAAVAGPVRLTFGSAARACLEPWALPSAGQAPPESPSASRSSSRPANGCRAATRDPPVLPLGRGSIEQARIPGERDRDGPPVRQADTQGVSGESHVGDPLVSRHAKMPMPSLQECRLMLNHLEGPHPVSTAGLAWGACNPPTRLLAIGLFVSRTSRSARELQVVVEEEL